MSQLLPLKKEYNWYAMYTRPRFEKRLASELEYLGFVVFLPLQKKLKQWSDRKKWVEEPLFRSYLFVYTCDQNRAKAFGTDGFVKYVHFNNVVATIPENIISNLKILLSSGVELEVVKRKLRKGEMVKVITGNMIGLEGEFISYKKKNIIVIKMEILNQYVSTEINLNNVQLLD